MKEWQELKVEDLGRVITGKTPSTKSSDFYGGKIPFVCIPDLGVEKRVRKTNKSLTNAGLNEVKNLIVPEGSVMVSCIATIGKVGIASTHSITNQQINSISLKEEIVDSDFLYYWFKNQGEKIGMFGGGGSVFNIISKSKFEKIKINLPPLYTQKAIAEILSSLDDKIELNNKINQNLEALAQTFFKQWFIDYEFPNKNGHPYKSTGGEMVDSELGEIPKGWKIATLGKFGEVICGKTPSKAEPENFGEDVPFVKIPDMHGKIFITETIESLSRTGANSQRKKLLPKGSVMVSSIATVGLVALTTRNSQTNQQINSIIPNHSFQTYFLYFLCLELKPTFLNLASGGAVTLNMNTSTFKSLKVIHPNVDILEYFYKSVDTIFEQILNLQIENEQLTSLRDTLLPKLISGELEVNESFLEQTF